MRISDWSSDVCSSDLVRAQTNDLPQIDRHVLRRIKFLPFARGNEQILPIWREGEAMGEMTVARNLRNLPPNDFKVPDLCGFARLIQNPFAPANGCAPHVVLPRFGPAQVNGTTGICGVGTESEPNRKE